MSASIQRSPAKRPKRSGSRKSHTVGGISWRLSDKLTASEFAYRITEQSINVRSGSEVNISFMQSTGFKTPIFIANPSGLQLKVPNAAEFTVRHVAELLGVDRVIDAMDVTTQKGQRISLGDFVDYYYTPSHQRGKLLNVLSLEFSNSKMDALVEAPLVVREIDWNLVVWPRALSYMQEEESNVMSKMMYPKVSKYCLMSVRGCFTDFHIDFGGSSVWYHVLRGEKIFWLIPPTDQNLMLFQDWTIGGCQNETFLGDLVSECYRIRLIATNTFFIPSGWIHAVYTPVDSLVFGGNFLHSYAIPMQLNIFEVENNIKVPNKFRFPFFMDMLWYAVERYIHAMTNQHFLVDNMCAIKFRESQNKSSWTLFELDGLCVLYDWLSESLTHKIKPPVNVQTPVQLLAALKDILRHHSVAEHQQAISLGPVLQPPDMTSLVVTSQSNGAVDSAESQISGTDTFEDLLAAAGSLYQSDVGGSPVKHQFHGDNLYGGIKCAEKMSMVSPPSQPSPLSYLSTANMTQQDVTVTSSHNQIVDNLTTSYVTSNSNPGFSTVNRSLQDSSNMLHSENVDTVPDLAYLLADFSNQNSIRSQPSHQSHGLRRDSIGDSINSVLMVHATSSSNSIPTTSACSVVASRISTCIDDVINSANAALNNVSVSSASTPSTLSQDHLRWLTRATNCPTDLAPAVSCVAPIAHPPLHVRSTVTPVLPPFSDILSASTFHQQPPVVPIAGVTKISQPPPPTQKRYVQPIKVTSSFQQQKSPLNSFSMIKILNRGHPVSFSLDKPITVKTALSSSSTSGKSPTTATTLKANSPISRISIVTKSNVSPFVIQQKVSPTASVKPDLKPVVAVMAGVGGAGNRVPPVKLVHEHDYYSFPPVDAGSNLVDDRYGGKVETIDALKLEQESIKSHIDLFSGEVGNDDKTDLDYQPIDYDQKPDEAMSSSSSASDCETESESDFADQAKSRTYGSKSKSHDSSVITINGFDDPKLQELLKRLRPDARTEVVVEHKHSLPDKLLRRVLSLLNRREICRVMLVSKQWYRVGMACETWKNIDLSYSSRTFDMFVCTGLVKRQPTSLLLAHVSIPTKNLSFLLPNLKCLRRLSLSGAQWATVSALAEVVVPALSSLNISNVACDEFDLRSLITNATYLCDQLIDLNLSYVTSVTDTIVRVIGNKFKRLSSLNLSHCPKISAIGIACLSAQGTSTRNSIHRINLSGCSGITQECFEHCERFVNVQFIDFSFCGFDEFDVKPFVEKLNYLHKYRFSLKTQCGSLIISTGL